WLEIEAARDELDDGSRIVGRVIDVAALGERRNDDCRDACAWAPAITCGRRNVVPEAAIFVVGHDDNHILPLRAPAQALEQLGNVSVAAHQIGIAWVLREAARRLVERDL